MRDISDIERFLEEVIYEIQYLLEIGNDHELPYWVTIRDTLQWVLDQEKEDFVFREDLEMNKSAVRDNG